MTDDRIQALEKALEESQAETAELRQKLLALEQEIAGEAEYQDHRLRYVSIQVDRSIWLECLRKHAPQLLPEQQ